MSFEVPTDLINQSQIGFRQDAGLSSFNPEDPTLPSPPTVEASISALEPSPPFLRCQNCSGKLLRGLDSLTCIYCGLCQARDIPPDPIFFNSSTGYRWLLESLKLNALEKIGPKLEEERKNRGRNLLEDGITLDELLDLQISWPDQPEKPPETGFVNKTFNYSISSLNRSKFELEIFFRGSQRNIVYDEPEEQEPPVTSKNDQTDASVDQENDQTDASIDQENLSLFQNVLPPETAAISMVQDDDSNSDDRSAADPSAQMDSISGQTVDLSVRKLNNNLDPLEDDLSDKD